MTHVFLYRRLQQDGRSSDWCFTDSFYQGKVLTIYSGRSGTVLHRTEIPVKACRQSMMFERWRRRKDKLDEGYEYLGQYYLLDNRRDVVRVEEDALIEGRRPSKA